MEKEVNNSIINSMFGFNLHLNLFFQFLIRSVNFFFERKVDIHLNFGEYFIFGTLIVSFISLLWIFFFVNLMKTFSIAGVNIVLGMNIIFLELTLLSFWRLNEIGGVSSALLDYVDGVGLAFWFLFG